MGKKTKIFNQQLQKISNADILYLGSFASSIYHFWNPNAVNDD